MTTNVLNRLICIYTNLTGIQGCDRESLILSPALTSICQNQTDILIRIWFTTFNIPSTNGTQHSPCALFTPQMLLTQIHINHFMIYRYHVSKHKRNKKYYYSIQMEQRYTNEECQIYNHSSIHTILLAI